MPVLDEAGVAAVRTLLERYIAATYRADLKELEATFHPAASMAGYLGDELVVGTPASFFADVMSHPPMAAGDVPYAGDIVSVHVSGRTASAVVYESGFFGSLRFANHFALVMTGGVWKIVSKTFETLAS